MVLNVAVSSCHNPQEAGNEIVSLRSIFDWYCVFGFHASLGRWGAVAFKKCVACHEVVKPVNKLGPQMIGIVGRKGAGVDGYKYSDAMMAYAATVPVWDNAALDAYLENPKAIVAKTKL